MLIGSIFVGIAYVAVADYVPLIASIRNYGELEGEDVRHSIYQLPSVLVFLYAVAVRLFLPYCVLYSFFMSRSYGGRWKTRFWMILALALGITAFSLERSPSLGLFLLLLLSYLLTSKRANLSRYGLLLAAALAVGGLIHQAQYQLPINPADALSYMTGFLLSRIWLDPSYMTSVAFQEFNSSTGFLGGKSIRLLSLFGVPYESFSSVGFVGDLWANFGWTGVILGSLLLGFVLQTIQLKFFRKKTLPVLMTYVLFLVNELWLLYGSIVPTMVVVVFSAGLLFLTLLGQLEETAPLGARQASAYRFVLNSGRTRHRGNLGFNRSSRYEGRFR